MLIRKKQQPAEFPQNNIHGAYTQSNSDTYTCNYINGIIESGANNIGTWVKYADGTMICTQKLELVNVSVNSNWSGWYTYSEASGTWHSFPQTFTEVNSFHIDTYKVGTGFYGFMVGDIGRRQVENDRWQGITLFRPSSATGVNATLCITAIGRWK